MLHAYSLGCGMQLVDYDTSILSASAQQTYVSCARLHDGHLHRGAAGHALLRKPVLSRVSHYRPSRRAARLHDRHLHRSAAGHALPRKPVLSRVSHYRPSRRAARLHDRHLHRSAAGHALPLRHRAVHQHRQAVGEGCAALAHQHHQRARHICRPAGGQANQRLSIHYRRGCF